ncbi:hypothetical protein DFH29DRAFT_627561 [Suillus ampliporus]|nr:hypothetical protein DFH29DRAFT_627561 [Suillus ampliporus]
MSGASLVDPLVVRYSQVYDPFSHTPRSMSHPPPYLKHLISVYLFLLITGGHVLLPVIVTTALLNKKLSWHPTLINLCITWVFYSVIHCLYLYTGEYTHDRYRTVCMVQAAMIYGAAPMATVAGLGVVIHTWTTIQHFERNFAEKFPRWLCRLLIISPPYMVFAAFSIGAWICTKLHTAKPLNGLFCTTYVQSLALAVPAFCVLMMTLVLGFEVAITIQFYRRWKRIKNSFPLIAPRRPSTSLIFRAGLFCLYSWAAFIVAIVFLIEQPIAVTYHLVPAALPLASALVFGLQKDMIYAWFPCLRMRKLPAGSTPEIPNARPAFPNSLSQATTVEP